MTIGVAPDVHVSLVPLPEENRWLSPKRYPIQRLKLAAELARSGHGVRFVDSDEALQNELGTGDYDVVIAAYTDQSAIQAGSAASSNAPTFLPVALTEEEEAAARQDYERVMVAQDDEIKHYLKAIHQTLKGGR